jgi:DNA recombination protein RmuC
MNTILYILLALLLVGFGVMLYFLQKLAKSQQKPQDDSTTKMMMEWMKQVKEGTDMTRQEIQKSMDYNNRTMNERLDINSKHINERLDNAAKVIGAVTKELGQMQQIGKSLSYVQDFLLSAKKRGTIGEQIMEEMLKQSLPAHMYSIQYRFRSGETADSIVRIGERLLAMDSKFSMENYRAYINAETDELRDTARKIFIRDIKKRIDEISKKYIVPAENTFDFALMYVPADGVFHEISDDVEVYEYARNKHVHIVSPSTFYYFLQVLLVGLQRERINGQAEQILKIIQGLRQDSEKFAGNLSILTKHITNAKSTLEIVGGSYERIHGKIEEMATLKIEETKDQVKVEAVVEKVLQEQ